MVEKRKVASAGLWVRTLAFALDYLPIAAYLTALVIAGAWTGSSSPSLANAVFGDPISGQAAGFLLITVPVTLYFSLFEASARQATWGKQRLSLRVTDLAGARMSLPRSIGRTALKFIPWELAHLCIWQVTFARDPAAPVYMLGFAIVWLAIAANVVSLLVSPSCQTLYDRAAGTLVVRGRPPRTSG